ncbi:uncharacterized protein TNCV_1700401 [Trichonephila clavipes]|nr:uncharacterized protein TNCV_1700401 [Trichonephila clavipes]
MTGPTQPPAGVELQSSLKIVFLITMSPPRPRFGIASATIIDYALIKNLNWPCNIDSIPELSPDHNPIKLHFPKTANFELPPPQLNTNWNVFTKTLANTENLYLPQASSTSEIESQIRELSSEILNALVKASRPMIHSEPPLYRVSSNTSSGREIKPEKLWQFTRFPQHKTDLNRLQNKIKRLVGKYKQQVWEDHLTSLDAEDGSLWGTARVFGKRPSRFPPLMALTTNFSPSELKQAGGENYLYQIKCIPRERKHPCSGAARVPSSSLHLPSTTRVVEYIKDAFDRNQHVAAVFLDIQKKLLIEFGTLAFSLN